MAIQRPTYALPLISNDEVATKQNHDGEVNRIAGILADNDEALEQQINAVDLKADSKAAAVSAGRMFATRAAAVSYGQPDLPSTLGFILTLEGDEVVVRSPANGNDPLFGSSPYWAEVVRININDLEQRVGAAETDAALFSSVFGMTSLARSLGPDMTLIAIAQIGWLWQDQAKTIPATEDGDPVEVIADQSGCGHDLINSSGTPWALRRDGAQVWLEGDGDDIGGVPIPDDVFDFYRHECGFMWCVEFDGEGNVIKTGSSNSTRIRLSDSFGSWHIQGNNVFQGTSDQRVRQRRNCRMKVSRDVRQVAGGRTSVFMAAILMAWRILGGLHLMPSTSFASRTGYQARTA